MMIMRLEQTIYLVSSAPETAPVESSENASSSSAQQSSSINVSTPPNASSCKYSKELGRLQIDMNWNFS